MEPWLCSLRIGYSHTFPWQFPGALSGSHASVRTSSVMKAIFQTLCFLNIVLKKNQGAAWVPTSTLLAEHLQQTSETLIGVDWSISQSPSIADSDYHLNPLEPTPLPISLSLPNSPLESPKSLVSPVTNPLLSLLRTLS
jgi:hypothetical protein